MDRKDYKYIYNSLNKNGSDRNFNYPIYIRNKEVATQEWVSKTIEGGLEGLEGNYLTIVKAEADYLSKVDAQNTYLTKVNAQNTYLSKNDANTTYLTNEKAQSTYQRKGNYVTLNSSNQIDSTYLPSYVDDVLEFDSRSNFPSSGESGKIYVATDTNLTYRWGGSEYVEISKSLALGETSSTAYGGDKGKENRTRIEALENNKANKSDIPTKTSQLTNDSGFLTSHQDISGKANLNGGNTFSGNQIFTGYLDIRGTAAEKHLKTRGIGGSDGNGSESDLYLQYNSNYSTKFGKSGNGSLNSDGTITEAGTLLSNKYAPKSHSHSEYLTSQDIANKADKGTKLSDYGITDAYTKTDINDNFVKQKAFDENNQLTGIIGNTGQKVGMSHIQSSNGLQSIISMQDSTEADPFNIKIESFDNFGGEAIKQSQILVNPNILGMLSENRENHYQSFILVGDENGTNQQVALAADEGTNNKTLLITPTSAAINGEEIATQPWVEARLTNIDTSNFYTKTEVDNKLSSKANTIHDHNIATSSTAGFVKSSTTGTTANRDYNVQVNSDGTMKVNVPWTDTNTWRGIQNNLTSDSTTDSLSAAQGKVLKGLVDGKANISHTHSYLSLSGGSLTGVVKGGLIDTHPENGGTVIGYYTNDLAYLRKRGGSCVATNVTQSTSISVNDNWFDGSPSYGGFSVTATTDVVQIIIKSPTAYSWSTTGGIGFGAATWRAKSVKMEMGYSATNKGNASSPDSDIVWVTRINVTGNANGVVYSNSCSGPNVSEGGVSAGTWSYIRLTLTDWNSTGPRIAQIFTINYGSTGMHNTFLSRSGGNVYGSITPYSNNSYNLGTSSNKWASVYATTIYENGTALSNKYASISHAHGNITQDGLLATADQVVVTDSNKKITSVAKGTAFNKDFGTTAGTVSEGNHTHDDMYVKGPSSATNNNIAIFDGETGKLIKTSTASIIDNQTLSILTRLSFRNRENSSIEMMSNGKSFYLQSFQGKIYLGSTLNTSTYWDADGVARFQALPNVKGKNVSLEGHTHAASEITDFPTIPTVNNATLTIQKNGTNVATFTANSSTNTTANITVPTKVSELSNDSGFIKNTGPSENGETKLYNRYAQKGYTGGGSTYWYYKIATLPQDNAGNYASLIITGRIGGWEAGNMSSVNVLIFNRGGDGIVAIDLAKTSSASAYNLCDIVCYRESDNKTSVYLKCAGYFTFDINVESYQSGIILPTSVSYTTSVTGTEKAKLSTSSSRLEVYNGNAYVGGTRLVKSNESLKNPYSLIIGGKAYDGSSSKTITAEDLGITSGDGGITSIYVIDLTSGTVLALDGGQVNVNGYVLTMVYSDMGLQSQTMTISLNQGDTEALVAVVNNNTDEIMVESCYGSVYDFVPDTVSEWQNYHVEVFNLHDYSLLEYIGGMGGFQDIKLMRSNFTQVCSIKLNEAGTQWIIY